MSEVLPPWAVAKIDKFIGANLDRNISNDELAGLLNMSKSHFQRRFKTTYGKTPHRVVTESKIDLARFRLRAGESQVLVASATGFSDQSHLCKTFLKITGETISQFMQRMK